MRAIWPLWAALALHGCAEPQADKPELALMTSLPIYWQESDIPRELLNADAQAQHPVRTLLEARFALTPVDDLQVALKGQQRLLLIQPRGLAPGELVALDKWVRDGGQLLLFADPLLVAESRYPLGDPRRPPNVTLMSPLLAHWGVEMLLDENQPDSMQANPLGKGAVLGTIVQGRFVVGEKAGADCAVEAAGLMASCRVGKGRALLIADADGFDPELMALKAHEAALSLLLDRAFR